MVRRASRDERIDFQLARKQRLEQLIAAKQVIIDRLLAEKRERELKEEKEEDGAVSNPRV